MPTDEVDLNHEQLAVVEAAVDARLLVVAGAGQGKTEVVASRIDYLVKSEDLSASREVLVLSFSRAAVTAVRTRLHDRDVPAANVRTFDSFAGQLLTRCRDRSGGLLRVAYSSGDPVALRCGRSAARCGGPSTYRHRRDSGSCR